MTPPEKGTTWETPDGRLLVVNGFFEHRDIFQPEQNRDFVGVLAIDGGPAVVELVDGKRFSEDCTQVKILAVEKQHRNPWEVYLADRADGCKGHFAIARWNPGGYQEVWNLRKHTWAAASDEVLTLEEAQKMLQSISFHPMTPSIRSL